MFFFRKNIDFSRDFQSTIPGDGLVLNGFWLTGYMYTDRLNEYRWINEYLRGLSSQFSYRRPAYFSGVSAECWLPSKKWCFLQVLVNLRKEIWTYFLHFGEHVFFFQILMLWPSCYWFPVGIFVCVSLGQKAKPNGFKGLMCAFGKIVGSSKKEEVNNSELIEKVNYDVLQWTKKNIKSIFFERGTKNKPFFVIWKPTTFWFFVIKKASFHFAWKSDCDSNGLSCGSTRGEKKHIFGEAKSAMPTWICPWSLFWIDNNHVCHRYQAVNTDFYVFWHRLLDQKTEHICIYFHVPINPVWGAFSIGFIMFQLVKKLAIDSVKLEYPMGGLFPARQVGCQLVHMFSCDFL